LATKVDIPLAAETDDLPVSPYRPVPRDHRLGRWLRSIAGVKEDALGWVPEERPRYTRLGAIILNTGCLAALSLLAALDKIFGVHWVFLIPVAAFWGWVIVSIDGWLVSSTHGMVRAARLRVFFPRLLLALLIGFVIAEPLVLRIFQPAINRQVLDTRTQEAVAYESLLHECNPEDGRPVDRNRCNDVGLNIKGSPDGVRQKLTEVTQERDGLKRSISGINKELEAKENLARAECNGRSGIGLSGIVGEGPNCGRDRMEADRFRTDSRLQEHQAHLTSLNQEIVELTAQLGNATLQYGQEVNKEIATKVEEKRSHHGKIGILEEEEALGQLSSRSFFVLSAHWLVRLLLIVVDCLPILTKLIGGTTTYDRLLSRQLVVDDELHDMESRLRKRRDTADKEVELQQIEHNVRRGIERIAEADRMSREKRDAELDMQIDALAARLRRQAGGADGVASDDEQGHSKDVKQEGEPDQEGTDRRTGWGRTAGGDGR
jgi:hypothetical protein